AEVQPQPADDLTIDALGERCDAESEYSGRAVDRWICGRREWKLLAVKRGTPFDDLDEFRFAYHIAAARRLDASITTSDQDDAAHGRINAVVNAERQRRAALGQATLDAERRADSLSALAAQLGAIVREQPPAPITSPYSPPASAQITCTRWQN